MQQDAYDFMRGLISIIFAVPYTAPILAITAIVSILGWLVSLSDGQSEKEITWERRE